MKINTHILGLLVVVGLFSLQSCDDESYDIEGSNQNYVYINVNRWTSTEYPQNTFVYEVLRTPIGSSLESGPEIVMSRHPIQWRILSGWSKRTKDVT